MSQTANALAVSTKKRRRGAIVRHRGNTARSCDACRRGHRQCNADPVRGGACFACITRNQTASCSFLTALPTLATLATAAANVTGPGVAVPSGLATPQATAIVGAAPTVAVANHVQHVHKRIRGPMLAPFAPTLPLAVVRTDARPAAALPTGGVATRASASYGVTQFTDRLIRDDRRMQAVCRPPSLPPTLETIVAGDFQPDRAFQLVACNEAFAKYTGCDAASLSSSGSGSGSGADAPVPPARPMSDFVRSKETLAAVLERHQTLDKCALPLCASEIVRRPSAAVIRDRDGRWHSVDVDKSIVYVKDGRAEQLLLVLAAPCSADEPSLKLPSPWCCG